MPLPIRRILPSVIRQAEGGSGVISFQDVELELQTEWVGEQAEPFFMDVLVVAFPARDAIITNQSPLT